MIFCKTDVNLHDAASFGRDWPLREVETDKDSEMDTEDDEEIQSEKDGEDEEMAGSGDIEQSVGGGNNG